MTQKDVPFPGPPCTHVITTDRQ